MDGMTKCFETHSPEETRALGRKLGEKAASGELFCLNGDLGAGKTVFVKGFAEGLGISEDVVSPTFTILQIYESGRLPLYHFDVYRIGDPEEMDEIGYEDYFFGEGVTVVEWSDLIRELLPEDAVRILIEKTDGGDDERRITVTEYRHDDSRN